VSSLLLRLLTQILNDKRRVNLQQTLCPPVLHVPVVEVVLEHFVVRVVDLIVRFELAPCDCRYNTILYWSLTVVRLVDRVNDLFSKVVARASLLKEVLSNIVGVYARIVLLPHP
jgi:hypothetical protein